MAARCDARRFFRGASLVSLFCVGAAHAADTGAALRHGGDQVLLTLHGVGAQIYECRTAADGTFAWTFQAPQADLLAGSTRVGQHGAGPSWTYQDGSRITGKVEDKVAGATPGDIPWLRLAVVSHEESGAFAPVTTVIRSATKGGVLAGTCDQPGAVRNVPYEADYTFVAGG